MTDSDSKRSIGMEENIVGEPKVILHEYHHGDDIAFKVLGDGSIDHAPITEEEIRTVRRKAFIHILPLLFLVYGFLQADKNALGNGAVFGLLTDLKLVTVVATKPKLITNTTKYSNTNVLTAVGTILGTFVLGPVGQHYPTGKFMGILSITWGICNTCVPAINSYAGIMVQRLVLGFLEGGIYPAVLTVLGSWFTKQEQGLAAPLINSGAAFMTSFFGLLCWGVVTIGPAAHAWKPIFYFIGPLTILWGILLLIFFPDSPVSARFLTPREKYVVSTAFPLVSKVLDDIDTPFRRKAVERLRSNQAGVLNRKFKFGQALSAYLDPKVLLLMLMAFCAVTPSTAVNAFAGLVIKNLYGANSRRTLLLSMPSGFISGICTILGGYIAYSFQNARLATGSGFTILVIIGCALQWKLPLTERQGLLAGVYLASVYAASYAQVIGLAVSNVAGSSKKSFVAASLYSSGALAGVAGPFYFSGNQAPRYLLGFKVTTIIMCIGLGLNLVYAIVCYLENKRRDSLPPPAVDQAFEDLPDTKNTAFRYTY